MRLTHFFTEAAFIASTFTSTVAHPWSTGAGNFKNLGLDIPSPIEERQARPTGYQVYYFDQLIDHFPDSDRYKPHPKGTFKQRYWFDDTYYESGGPVFLYISGETAGENRWSNLEHGIIQILMQATSGLGVILENRFYGDSFPFNTSTTDQLAFLTTEQTIADNPYFAQNAVFPGVGGGNLTAPDTPWILYGGSLAGQETAFSIVEYGDDILFGGIASSAPVEVVVGYHEWYNPVQKYGPQDCITRINAIIEKADKLIDEGNSAAIQELKEIFGLGGLKDIRDFAMTIAFPIGGPMNYPTATWQELNWYPGYTYNDFFNFCGNVTIPNPPANISAIDTQLSKYTNGESWVGLGNYATYFIQNFVEPLCPDGDVNSVYCFGTQNETFYADPTNGADRSYLYTTCAELGAYQVAPTSYPSLILNVLQDSYTQQWCTWAFPAGIYNSIPPNGPDLKVTNKYGGFNISAPRLALIDGDSDVWLDLCYHSNGVAGLEGPGLRTGDNHYLITGAGHHWDSYGILDVGAEPLFIQQAHLWEIRRVKTWLGEFEEWRAGIKKRKGKKL